MSCKLAEERLRVLRYDNDTIKKVTTLILYHDLQISGTKESVRKWMGKIGIELLEALIKVKEADCKAQNPEFYDARHKKLLELKELTEEILKNNECFTIKDLAIDGEVLIGLGYKQGREIGQILRRLLNAVIEDNDLNTREKLLELIKRA